MFLAFLSKINWLHMHGFISGLSFPFHWSMCLFFFIPVVVIVYLLRNGARWQHHGLRMRGNGIAEAMKQEWNTDRSEVEPGPWRTAEFSSFHGQGSENLLVGFINQSGQIAHLCLTWDSVVPRTWLALTLSAVILCFPPLPHVSNPASAAVLFPVKASVLLFLNLYLRFLTKKAFLTCFPFMRCAVIWLNTLAFSVSWIPVSWSIFFFLPVPCGLFLDIDFWLAYYLLCTRTGGSLVQVPFLLLPQHLHPCHLHYLAFNSWNALMNTEELIY